MEPVKKAGPFDLCYNQSTCFKEGCPHYHLPRMSTRVCIYYIRYNCTRGDDCPYSHDYSYEDIAIDMNSKVLKDPITMKQFILDPKYTDKYIESKVKEKSNKSRTNSPDSNYQTQQKAPQRNKSPSRLSNTMNSNENQQLNKNKTQQKIKKNKKAENGHPRSEAGSHNAPKEKERVTGYAPDYDEWEICKFGAACNDKSCPSHHPQWLTSKNYCIRYFRDENSCNEKYCKLNHFKWQKVKDMRFITEENSKDFKTGLPFQPFSSSLLEETEFRVNEQCKCTKCMILITVKAKFERTVTNAIGKFVCMDCMKKKFTKYERVIFKIKMLTEQF